MRKGTFLIPSGTDADPNRRHLFVALTDPQGQDGRILLASFSTVTDRYYCEETCTLDPEDVGHPFITERSFIRYQKLRWETVDDLRSGLRSGSIQQMQDLAEEVVASICQGVEDSPFAATKYKKFLARIGA